MCGKSSVFVMIILVFALFFTACGSGEGDGSDTGGYEAVAFEETGNHAAQINAGAFLIGTSA